MTKTYVFTSTSYDKDTVIINAESLKQAKELFAEYGKHFEYYEEPEPLNNRKGVVYDSSMGGMVQTEDEE